METKVKQHIQALISKELNTRRDELGRALIECNRGYMEKEELQDYENDVAFEVSVLSEFNRLVWS